MPLPGEFDLLSRFSPARSAEASPSCSVLIGRSKSVRDFSVNFARNSCAENAHLIWPRGARARHRRVPVIVATRR